MTNENVKLTKQDLFNNAWRAFVVEKSGPSYAHDTGGCLYLSANGCRCAIGVSFPSDMLNEIIARDDNSADIDLLVSKNSDVKELLSYCNMSFARSLQRCHDGVAGRKDFSEKIQVRLERFAITESLQIPQ
jgi:hypothetical protein